MVCFVATRFWGGGGIVSAKSKSAVAVESKCESALIAESAVESSGAFALKTLAIQKTKNLFINTP